MIVSADRRREPDRRSLGLNGEVFRHDREVFRHDREVFRHDRECAGDVSLIEDVSLNADAFPIC